MNITVATYLRRIWDAPRRTCVANHLPPPPSRAAIAAILKLQVYIELYNPTPSTDYHALWQQSMIWAVSEHGLSLFAASVLAVRPFFTYLSSSLSTLSSRGSDKNASWGGHRDSSRASASSGAPLHNSWPRPLTFGGGGGEPGTRQASLARGRDVELESRRQSHASTVSGIGSLTKEARYSRVEEVGERSPRLIREDKEILEAGEMV